MNSATFAVTGGTFRLSADVPESSDTEGAGTTGFKTFKAGGLKSAEFDLQTHMATDVVPFGAPLNLTPGTEVAILIYPKGLTYEPYSFTAVISRFENPFRVAGSEPQAGNISGMSTGTITLPSN